MTQQIDIPSQAVAVREETGQLPARRAATPLDMLHEMVQRGVTTENAAAFEQLVKLSEHMEDREAEKAFARAFNALQAEMPAVKATKPVHMSEKHGGGLKFKFAPFEDIMEQVAPMLQKHGFTVCFSTRYEQIRLVKICTLQHIGGHSRSNEFAVRIGSGPPGSSESQADGAAGTYAKRFALCDALNIVIETDTDAKLEGDYITEQEAMDLKTRVTSLGMSEASFLKLGQAKTYGEIRSAVLPVLLEVLSRKEKRA